VCKANEWLIVARARVVVAAGRARRSCFPSEVRMIACHRGKVDDRRPQRVAAKTMPIAAAGDTRSNNRCVCQNYRRAIPPPPEWPRYPNGSATSKRARRHSASRRTIADDGFTEMWDARKCTSNQDARQRFCSCRKPTMSASEPANEFGHLKWRPAAQC